MTTLTSGSDCIIEIIRGSQLHSKPEKAGTMNRGSMIVQLLSLIQSTSANNYGRSCHRSFFDVTGAHLGRAAKPEKRTRLTCPGPLVPPAAAHHRIIEAAFGLLQKPRQQTAFVVDANE